MAFISASEKLVSASSPAPLNVMIASSFFSEGDGEGFTDGEADGFGEADAFAEGFGLGELVLFGFLEADAFAEAEAVADAEAVAEASALCSGATDMAADVSAAVAEGGTDEAVVSETAGESTADAVSLWIAASPAHPPKKTHISNNNVAVVMY